MSLLRILVLLLMTFCLAPAARAEMEWQPYRSSVDGFSALFPGKPQEMQKDFGSGAMFHQFLVDDGNMAFMVIYTQYAPGTLVGKDPKRVLDKAKEGLFAGEKVTVRVDRSFEFALVPAREIVIDDAHGSTQIYRLYLVGDRIYQVICGGPKGFEKTDEAQRFEDSFRLLSR